MKTSLIRYRVADFLKLHPPFQFFSDEDLLTLAGSGRVQFHERGELVFKENQPLRPFIWVIQQGSVELLEDHLNGGRVRDILGEGAVLGLEAEGDSELYTHSVKTTSDVLLYALDVERFKATVSRYPQAGHFVRAVQAAAHTGGAAHAGAPGHESRDGHGNLWLVRSGPTPDMARRRLVVCPPSLFIREAAHLLGKHHSDLMAVTDSEGRPLGTVTRAALTDRVATGEVSVEAPCSAIMECGLPTAVSGIDTGSALLAMTRARTRFLGITADGTGASPLEGMITDRDLVLYRGINPALLLGEILEARDAFDLARVRARIEVMLADGLTESPAVDWFCQCLSELHGAFLERVIELCRPDHSSGFSTGGMCWLLFGAAGRREILTPMLPWIAVVYQLPHSDFGTEAQSGCQQWADRVVEVLRSCGFLPSGELRPHRPQCLSLSAWKNLFQQLVTDPIGQGIYESRALFDLRCSAGDPSLAAELFGHVGELLRQNDVFLAVLANDSMVNLPPLTLFHDLVVETDGQQHETLDLAQTLLDPVADVGRVFSLARNNLAESETTGRMERAAEAIRSHRSLFLDAADAFRFGLFQRTLNGLCEHGESSLLRPSSLSRYDQQMLKHCFRSVLDLVEFTWANFKSIREL